MLIADRRRDLSDLVEFISPRDVQLIEDARAFSYSPHVVMGSIYDSFVNVFDALEYLRCVMYLASKFD